MYAKLEMEIQTEEAVKIPSQKAVLLQGVLMGRIAPEYAQMYHESRLHPYSQSLCTIEGKNIWSICTLNEQAYHQIICPLNEESFDHFVLEHDGCDVAITERQVQCFTQKEFMDQYYFTDSNRYIRLAFQTPMAFKQQGRYINYPDLHLLYQSLMKKYDAASPDESLENEEVLDLLVANSRVAGYRLCSCQYSIHGAKIPAFVGEITIYVKGPQAMVNLANMLFHFGEYSGAGIKSAMGMGKIQVIERQRR